MPRKPERYPVAGIAPFETRTAAFEAIAIARDRLIATSAAWAVECGTFRHPVQHALDKLEEAVYWIDRSS